ncbi:hypothetical protein NW762_010556 [Fusarium torreyae]|uniref:Uncharacterized protein n=1 Tax=Fusarium torreyae TaxID=1237075 RepID=A0A9W8RU82_9HYPO|nr:hypothetical protein NW762_010556 [Fusarium torreyae]
MSTVKTPPNQDSRSPPIANANNGVTSYRDRDHGQAATGAPVSNDHSNQGWPDAAQSQTSHERNASKRPIPPSISRYHKPKSKHGKYISKAWRVCSVHHRPSSRIPQKNRRTSVATIVSPDEGLDLTPAPPAPTSVRRPLSRHAFSVTPQEDPVDLTIHAHATPPSITPSSIGQSRQPTVKYTFNLELVRQHIRAQGAGAGDFESNDLAKSANCTRDGSPVAPDSAHLTQFID